MGTPRQQSTFADLLQRYRRAAGLTQEQLAERARMSVRGISNLERGVRRLPQRGTVTLLTEALGLAAAERATFEAAARGLGEPAPSELPGGPPLSQGGPVSPPLVGRAQELALLEEHLHGAGPPVLLLAGEPGIGKSRLLQEAGRRASGQGWRVLAGGCQRRGGQEPYAPLLEAIERSMRAQPPARLRAALQSCAWLVRLLPELAAGPIEPLPAWTLPPDQERRLMFKAVARFLQNVAGPAGTLLVLDDLQWAGTDALELLATLVRAAEVQLRVVGAYRDTELRPDEPLSAMLADLAQAGLAAHRTLAPLMPAEVMRLLGHILDRGAASETILRERVLQRAGGVPFFVISYAQGLREGASAAGTVDAVPWDLAQSLRQRIATLPKTTREVLRAAAVIGRQVPPALLLAVAERAEREVLAALDACRARLLIEAGQAYQFAHDVIREVVEVDAGAARRIALHRRVMRALEEVEERKPGTRVDLLAYHSRQAGEIKKAVHDAQLAGARAVRMSAYGDAVTQYEVALALLEVDERQARMDLLDKLVDALDPLGDNNVQLRYLQEARRLREQSGDRLKVGDLYWRLGIAYRRRGDLHAALENLRAGLKVLEAEPPGRGLAMTYSVLSNIYVVMSLGQEGIRWGRKALDLAANLGDAGISAGALINLGSSLTFTGEVERGIEHLMRGINLAQNAGLARETVRAYINLGFCLLRLGEYARAGEALRAGLAFADRTGWEALNDYLLANLGEVEMELGHWDEARDLLQRAFGHSEAAGSAQTVWSVLRTGELLRRQGRFDEAGQLLEGILPACENTDDSESVGTCLSSMAMVCLARGDRAGAVAAMDRSIERWQSKELVLAYDKALWRGIEVYLHVGRVDRAGELIEDCTALADRLASPAAWAYLAGACGMLATHQGRHSEAATHFKEAAERWQEMGCPYQEACMRRYRAESLLQSGAPAARAAAGRDLAAARAIFEYLGARFELEALGLAVSP